MEQAMLTMPEELLAESWTLRPPGSRVGHFYPFAPKAIFSESLPNSKRAITSNGITDL
jgi:hypothetical protein